MTYLMLSAAFLSLVASFVAVAQSRGALRAGWWRAVGLVLLALAVLTAVFDNVMIAADLVRYDAGALTGLRVGLVPVEDFAWPVAAALALPALWEMLGRRRPQTPAPRQGGDRVDAS